MNLVSDQQEKPLRPIAEASLQSGEGHGGIPNIGIPYHEHPVPAAARYIHMYSVHRYRLLFDRVAWYIQNPGKRKPLTIIMVFLQVILCRTPCFFCWSIF